MKLKRVRSGNETTKLERVRNGNKTKNVRSGNKNQKELEVAIKQVKIGNDTKKRDKWQ